MDFPTEFVSGMAPRDKIVTAAEAVALIRDGDTVVVEGFAGQCFAEELTLALEARFLQTGTPRDLTLAFTVAQGNREGRGSDRLCYEGLLKRAIGGHWGMSGELGKMAVENKIDAYNLPQGVIAQLFRDTAAGKPGLLTRVGLDTFVDPRNGGGKINERTTEDRVELMTVGGQEYLFYKAFERLDVAFLRGTTADPNGNIAMEREALFLESLAVATAVHNAGGLVIVQVERIAEAGSLHPKDVKIPGVLVDCVVVSTPEHHPQTWGTQYSPAMSGELRVPLSSVPPLELSVRKVIARRAAMELRPNAVVNLGIGIPEGVASVAAEEHVLSYITLTAEPGVIGGMPTGGRDFGSAINGDAILDQPAQFDFYDGGGLDAAFLGMAQADAQGNVNVSRFGPRLAGSGGFINISQNAKRVAFLGTFLAPCRTQVVDGRIVVSDDGVAAPKFLASVEQRTFSGQYAAAAGQPVLYVTERCVFRLTAGGLELIEVAPGVDIERDIIARLPFRPLMREVQIMDPRLFTEGTMGLRERMLELPLGERISYDPERNTLFLNFEGLHLRDLSQLEALRDAVTAKCQTIGKRMAVVVSYDQFVLDPGLETAYAATVADLERDCYGAVSRYTTSAFMRLKLAQVITREVQPHIFESLQDAQAFHSQIQAQLNA